MEVQNYAGGHTMTFMLYFSGYLILLYISAQFCQDVAGTSCYKLIAHLLASIQAVIMLVTNMHMEIFFVIDVRHLITIYYVPILFRIIYDLDVGFFRKQLTTRIIYAAAITILCSFGLGAGMVLLTGGRWGIWKIIFIYGFALGSIDYLDTAVSVLNMASFQSMLLVLIQVEAIIGIELCNTILALSVGIFDGLFSYWFQVFGYLIRMYLGGITYGFLVGRLMHLVIDTYLDSINDVGVFIIVSPVCVYYLGEYILYVSGNVAVLIYAYSFALHKARIPLNISKNLSKMNVAIGRIAQSLMIYFATIPFVIWTVHHFDRVHLKEYLCLYIITLAFRFFMLFFMLPAMKHVDERHTFSNLFVMSLIAKKGPVQIVNFLLILQESVSFELGCFCAPYTYFLVTTSMLISPEVLKLITSLFGLSKRHRTPLNVMSCIHHIEEVQELHISKLRNDSFNQDVNWLFVNRTLRLSMKLNDKMLHNDEQLLNDLRETYCYNCKQIVTFPPTDAEWNILMREANKSILQAHKMSFITQYRKGNFQKPVIVILLTFIEYSLHSEYFALDPTLFKHFIHKETVIVKIKALIKIVDMGSTIARPRFKRRRVIYNIVMYYLYEVFLLVMVLCSIALMFADVATRGNYDIIMQLKGAIVAIFFIDMINKIIAFSHIYIRQGFMIYFCNSWNQFDFILLILLCMDIVVVYYCRPCQIPDQVIPFGVIKGFVSIQFFKLWKFVFILKRFEYNILAFLDKMIGLRIMLAVDIGEAMIKSYDEILHTMPKMVENKDVCAAIMAQVKADRQIIKLELLNRTSERDWIMVTCKTHQMIRNCLYEMRLKIEELWVKGSISDYEYDKLRMSQEACLQNFFKLNSISKPSEHDLIANLGYILNDAVCDYCLNNAIKVKYRKDEEVLSMGRRIDGILVMASGLVQVTYEPFDADIYQRYGALPGVDDIEEELLFEPRSYSIMCGNILGEMGLLTQRPYHCRAVALEDSEFLAIPKSILEDATIMNTGSIHQLMWMHVTAKLLNSILWRTKPFQGCSENEVLMHVYKGYYPNLNDYASIERSKSVQDIVLIEGVVWDMATKDMFIAPCYLPRNVRFIGFSRSRHYMVNPKLFLIPVDESKMKLILKELEKTSRPRTDYDKVWEPGPGIIQDLVMSSLKPTHLFVELPPTYDDGEGRESMFYYNSEAFGAPYPRLKEMEKPPPPPPPVVQRNARMVISTKEIDSDAYFAEGPPAKRLRLESDSDLDFENLSKSKDD